MVLDPEELLVMDPELSLLSLVMVDFVMTLLLLFVDALFAFASKLLVIAGDTFLFLVSGEFFMELTLDIELDFTGDLINFDFELHNKAFANGLLDFDGEDCLAVASFDEESVVELTGLLDETLLLEKGLALLLRLPALLLLLFSVIGREDAPPPRGEDEAECCCRLPGDDDALAGLLLLHKLCSEALTLALPPPPKLLRLLVAIFHVSSVCSWS